VRVYVFRIQKWLRAINDQSIDELRQFIEEGFSVTHCLCPHAAEDAGVVTRRRGGREVVLNSPDCVSIEDYYGTSLLDHSVCRQRLNYPVDMELGRMLMRAGLEVDITTLQNACSEYNVELLRMLVQGNEELLEEVASDGSTLMHTWAQGTLLAQVEITNDQYEDTLRYLVAHNVPLENINDDGNTPLMLAAADRSQNMIMYLQMMQRAPHHVNVNHQNNIGWSAMHLLVQAHDTQREQNDTMQQRGAALLLLLKHGADPEIGRGDLDKRTDDEKINHMAKLRTPAQILTRADIPEGELDINNPNRYQEQPHFDVLVHVFARYMQRLHKQSIEQADGSPWRTRRPNARARAIHASTQ